MWLPGCASSPGAVLRAVSTSRAFPGTLLLGLDPCPALVEWLDASWTASTGVALLPLGAADEPAGPGKARGVPTPVAACDGPAARPRNGENYTNDV